MKRTMTDAEFEHLRGLLARLAGLVFDDSRRDSLTYSLLERMRETSDRSISAYLTRVGGDATERQRLLDEVTIQETHFFRNPPQMRALRRHVLPQLVRHAAVHGRRLRVWSAGCSTGEEAYTVAMLLREQLPSTAGWDVKVIATDVSERALRTARAARYGPRAVQMVAPADLNRFFDLQEDGWTVRDNVRELVEFRHHNLVTEPVPFAAGEGVDLVLCRNVTIYFSRDTTRQLMQRFYGCLRDGGFLFLGHSETLWQVSDEFRLVALGSGEDTAFVYRRIDPAVRRDRRGAVLPDRRRKDEGRPLGDRREPGRRALVVPLTASLPVPGSTPPPAGRPAVPTVPTTPAQREPAAALPVAAPAAKPATAPANAAPRPAAVGPGEPFDPIVAVRAALAEGRYNDAARLAERLTVVEPLIADGHYLRGLALVDLGRDADALVDLRKAVYLDPHDGLAHFLLAGVLARLGDPSAAAREYRAAADTLAVQRGTEGAPELGGRSVRDLISLCEQLEQKLTRAAVRQGEVR